MGDPSERERERVGWSGAGRRGERRKGAKGRVRQKNGNRG